MTCLPARFSIPVFALFLGACAAPPAPTGTAPEPPAPETPPYKKKPMMNGRGKITSVSFDQFFEMQQSGKAMIFDARPGFFYSIGHVPGAIHLPKNNCDEAIHNKESAIKDALAAGKTLIVYCSGRGCPDARTVAMHISGFGHPVSVFSGGWDAWKEAGLASE